MFSNVLVVRWSLEARFGSARSRSGEVAVFFGSNVLMSVTALACRVRESTTVEGLV